MAAISLPTSAKIKRGEKHGTGKDPPDQLGRPERRRLHSDDRGFRRQPALPRHERRLVDVFGSTLSVVALDTLQLFGSYDTI